MKNISENKNKLAIIFIGIPASGKSTFYRQNFEDEFVHINLDILHTRNNEKALIEKCLLEGKSFVVDNTNPTKENRQRYIPAAKSAGYRVEGYFFQSVLQDCIKRNSRRKGKAKIPDTAVASISNKLEMPDKSEGFDEIYFVSIDEKGFKKERWKDGES